MGPDEEPVLGAANWPALSEVGVRRHEGPQGWDDEDVVAVETPVALVFNGISHAVMLATPQDLEALALGFALSEGLIASPADCRDVTLHPHPQTGGIEVRLEIAPGAFAAFKQRRRTLAGRTGCGLCGVESLAQWDQPALPARPGGPAAPVAPARILRAFAELPVRQVLNRYSGACHAAAWAQPDGTLAQVFEDVGRHNALDKLLGQRAWERLLPPASPAGEGFVIVSSRASVELVRKCARLGVGALAAISAPTSLAVETARSTGLQLYGFCRGEQVVHYSP